MNAPPPPRGALAWAFYDWANSAFATTVVAGFFPVFFKSFWNKGVPETVSTARLGVAVSVAGVLVALLAPILGSLADQGAGRKRLLACAAGVAILATAGLPLVPQPAWVVAAAIYVLAYVAWLASCVFYDSLIGVVSTPATVDRVSGFGFAMGYLGGGLLFTLNVAMVTKPDAFGFADAGAAVRASFLTVAAWWAVFTIPLLVLVPDPRGASRVSLPDAVRRSVGELRATFHRVRGYRNIVTFLLAYWLYIDGVDTIITMAVAYGMSIGFDQKVLISSLLLVQFVAFPCAWAFGWLGQRFGTKRLILAGLAIYVLVTVLAFRLGTTPWRVLGFEVSQFTGLAVLIGTVQGGVQALSRSLYSRLIPEGAAAEFFGFYNMVGRFGAIVGPVLMGAVGQAAGEPRYGILAISLLLLSGGVLLLFVRDERLAS